jgi:hypothetical protein
MPYKIDYLDSKGLVGSDFCTGALSKAEAIAARAIASRLADTVEVRDDAGNIVLRLPKAVRSARDS